MSQSHAIVAGLATVVVAAGCSQTASVSPVPPIPPKPEPTYMAVTPSDKWSQGHPGTVALLNVETGQVSFCRDTRDPPLCTKWSDKLPLTPGDRFSLMGPWFQDRVASVARLNVVTGEVSFCYFTGDPPRCGSWSAP
jgi:hypothetical protein